MEKEEVSIGLDNPVFAGRLKTYQLEEEAEQKPVPKVLKITRPVSAIKDSPIKEEKAETASPIQFYFDDIDESKPIKHGVFKKNRRYKYVSNSLVFLALLLLCLGAYVAISGMKINQVIQGTHANAQAASSNVPDETKPSDEDINSYTVSSNMPRFIKIDKFGVKARVRSLGTNSNNQLRAPSNVFDAGWYKESALPGSAIGASVIDGHVSGTTQHGVFWDLKNVSAGDIITIERGDGELLNYKVISKESVDATKVDMAKVLVSSNTAKHGLNLITCTGQVHGREYDQRLIVYTEFIQ